MKRLASVLLVVALSAAAGTPTDDSQTQYQRGLDALMRGEPEKAAEYLEKAVALKPNDGDYHYQLANAYGQAAAAAGLFGTMSMTKKAKKEWERAVQLAPNLIPARFALLEFHLAAPAMFGGGESAAIEQAKEIAKRDAIDGHRAFALIHTWSKQPALARTEYLHLVKEQPASARAHYFFGVYLMLTEKNYKSASAEFETAVRLDPSYMRSYFQIGHVAALAENNFARGEEAMKKYLAYGPNHDEPSAARAYYWLGLICEKEGKKAEARSNYAVSLKINGSQKDVRAAMTRVR